MSRVSWGARFVCAIAGHQYRVLLVITPEMRKVGCETCGRAWGMRDGVRALLPWDGDLQALADMHAGRWMDAADLVALRPACVNSSDL